MFDAATNKTHNSHILLICYSLLGLAVEITFCQNISIDDTTLFSSME
jgi:hypothetical protein